MTAPDDFRAPGLAADWINGWLAALGVAVLVESARLRWSTEALPVAIFDGPDGASLPEALAGALASWRSRSLSGAALRRQASLDEYRAAAATARRQRDFTLAAALTDLALARSGHGQGIAASAFYASAPGPVGTLAERFERCAELIPSPWPDSVAASLAGTGRRLEANGLGLDVRRIAVGDMSGDFGSMRVDPAIECLAFFGLALLPVRGDGSHAATRGWRWRGRAAGSAFTWPIWSASLDRWSIDAALGLAFGEPDVRSWPAIVGPGIFGAFQTVEYTAKSQADPTRGFASRRML